MLVFSALTLESFASRVVANNAACVAGDARPSFRPASFVGRGPDRQKPCPILEPSAELYPARIYLEGGQRNVSTCCQQSFFGILLNGSILPSVCFSNLS